MTSVVPFRPAREAPKDHRSAMETLIFTHDQINQWKTPSFQRPVRTNAKVHALAEQIRHDSGVIPGIITLGTIKGDAATYVVDGQHRLEAFRISGLPECIGDFRSITFASLGEMADEFVTLNSALVRMRPDDILRGLEPGLPTLRKIRKDCPFVGFDQIRRGNSTSPILSMSVALKAWCGSTAETPVQNSGNQSAAQMAESLTEDAAEELIQFLTVAHAAWGRDHEYARLWSMLNLGLCMWVWRRLVKDRDRPGNKRYVVLTIKQFTACLMALSASGHYLEWLQGRHLADRDRGPAYARIKKLFAARLAGEMRQKIMFPQPAWASK